MRHMSCGIGTGAGEENTCLGECLPCVSVYVRVRVCRESTCVGLGTRCSSPTRNSPLSLLPHRRVQWGPFYKSQQVSFDQIYHGNSSLPAACGRLTCPLAQRAEEFTLA